MGGVVIASSDLKAQMTRNNFGEIFNARGAHRPAPRVHGSPLFETVATNRIHHVDFEII